MPFAALVATFLVPVTASVAKCFVPVAALVATFLVPVAASAAKCLYHLQL